jgi:hypothetical protein
MRVVLGTICLVLAASPVMASGTSVPAPLVGAGLPAMLAVGGILLVARIFNKK